MCEIDVAKNQDLEGINSVIRAILNTTSGYKPPCLLELLDIQQTKNQITFVAKDSGQIIGFLLLKNKASFQSDDDAEFEILCVHPARQGKGSGAFLLNHAIQHVRSKTKLKRLTLKVLNKNLRAIKLFEKAGFVLDYIDTLSNKGRWMSLEL